MKILNVVPGTPETGLWCDRCLLPSVYRVPLYVLGDDGPHMVGTHTVCEGCEGIS